MAELLKRLAVKPVATVLLLIATLFVSLLVLAPPIFVMLVLNRYVAFGVHGTLVTLTLGAVFAVGMEFLLRWARLRIATSISVKADDHLAERVGRLLTELTLPTIQALPLSLKKRIREDLDSIQQAFSAPVIIALLDAPFTIIVFVALFIVDPILAFITFVAAMIVVLSCLALSQRRDGGMRQVSTADEQAWPQDDAIYNPAQVRAFNMSDLATRKLRLDTRLRQAAVRSAAFVQGLTQSLVQTSVAVTTIAVVGVGAILVVRQEIDIGVLIAANILAARAVSGIATAASQFPALKKASYALKRLQKLEQAPREIKDGAALVDYQGGIEFSDVTFAHSGDVSPLFENVSLRLAPGDILVVHGQNGSGKTSFAELVAGLYAPLRGAILIDGLDLRKASMTWWRRQISYVPQSPVFLDASVADNLRTVNPGVSNEVLNRAIQSAGVRSIIAKSEEGLGSPLTQGGVTLSSGARKRLGFARALIAEGRIVVLDEPFEALDAEGRQMVAALLQNYAAANRTIIVCSSDPAIVREADWVLDLTVKPTPALSKGPGRVRKEANASLKVV